MPDPTFVHRNALASAAPPIEEQDGLFSALVGAAALVAAADGKVTALEGGILVDCLDRQGMLAAMTRRAILDAFSAAVEQLERPEGIAALVAGLRAQAQAPAAQLILEIGERVACADGDFHPRERAALTLIRDAIGLRATE